MLKDIAAFCNTTSTFELVLKMKKKTKKKNIMAPNRSSSIIQVSGHPEIPNVFDSSQFKEF